MELRPGESSSRGISEKRRRLALRWRDCHNRSRVTVLVALRATRPRSPKQLRPTLPTGKRLQISISSQRSRVGTRHASSAQADTFSVERSHFLFCFPRTPQGPAGFCAGVLAALENLCTIYENMLHTDRVLVRLFKRRAIRNSRRIKHHHVGKHSLL